MKKLLLPLLAIFLLASCNTIRNDNGAPSAYPYKKDIVFLYDFLEKNHPDFYNTVKEEEAKQILNRNISKSDIGSPASFYYSLCEIAAIPHDSHTQVGMDGMMVSDLKILPIGFDKFKDGLYIVMASDGYENLIGKKVVSINGYPFEDIIAAARMAIPSDNDIYLAKSLYGNHMRIYQFYEHLGLLQNEGIIIVETEDMKKTDIHPQPYMDAAGLEYSYLQKAIPSTLNPSSIYSAMLLDEPTAILINYHACMEMESFPFLSFCNQVLDLIAKNGYKSIVIDLRYNKGGDSSIISPLVEGLAKLKEQKDIAVYVLIGEDSFSSAIMNAEQMKERLDAILVGRPTGGSVSHYGEILLETLPETGVMFQYSTKYFSGPCQGPLMPDIFVERNMFDYENGIDTDLKALGLIH